MRRTRQRLPSARDEHMRLLHDLEVHKIELEMQNQSLREDRNLLERSRARYAAIYEFAPVGHITLGPSGVIEELNLACATLLGKGRRSLRGRPLREVVAPQSRAMLDAHLRTCFKSERPVSVELMVPLAGGDARAVELLSASPLANDGEVPAMLHSVVIDVSARKRDDERRDSLLRREREARVLAERVNDAKELFLALVSHELRTPLVPMLMWTRALRAGGLDEEVRGRALEAIDNCLAIEVAMIDDLVDVARGRHGKLRVERRPLDVKPIVAAAVEAIAPSAAAKRIEIIVEVDPAPVQVAGDPVRLRQVVGNLLSNAVKFTDVAGHVLVSVHARGDEVVLAVRDDGEGIDGELLDRIFEPFSQRDVGTARRHSGLGLGLTIVRQLVGQHDGRIAVESAGPGRGSCFTVSLPRFDEQARLEPGAERPPGATPDELAGIVIVVVEDQGATREGLEVVLRAQRAEVHTASSAAAARAAIARYRPHVLVSDVGMPDEDGYTFMRKLRAREARLKAGTRLPAVAFTAHASGQDRQRALAAGFDELAAKPLDVPRLVSVIGALARRGAAAGRRLPAPRKRGRRVRRSHG